MPTSLQLANLFNVFGSLVVLGLSIITLRFYPSRFFRYWVVAYAWALTVSTGSALEAFVGRSFPLFVANTVGLALMVGFLLRLGCELRGRPFPLAAVVMGLGAVLGAGVAAWLAGLGFEAAVAPGAIAMMVSYVWLGVVMIQAGRAEAHEGLGWLGAPVALHGLWLLTYPAFAASSFLWLGFTVEAVLQIGIGAGMALYALFHATRRLARQNAALRDAERALREAHEKQRGFLNAASHEMRTPLTSVLGYADFLLEEVGGPLNERQAEHATRIRRGAGRLARFVDDMLDWSMIEAGEFALAPEAVDVAALARSEAGNFLPQMRERQVAIALDLPTAPAWAQVDPLRLGQVLTNLLTNAVKYTPAGATVHVRVRGAGPEVRVEVRDEGPGIGAEHLPRLFEKFYRVDPDASRELGGAGLGLAISRAIVEAHGGRIGVDSEPGRGATFWFTLPAGLENKPT